MRLSFASLVALGLTLVVVAWPASLDSRLAVAQGVAAQGTEPTAHEHSGHSDDLGEVHFPTSCLPSVQPDFDRAVALLHSFAYTRAREAFGAVLEGDPTCAMAYWGIAMTWQGNPFWPLAVGAWAPGRRAVDGAQALGAPSPRERDYIAAVDLLYQESAEVPLATRQDAYEQAMADLYRRYPDDREAAVFYALALVSGADPADQSYTRQLAAAALLEPVFAEQPRHPGAAHYLIHSYDVPGLAPRGQPAAQRYGGIAPAAAHALHMPSHIYTRLGRWPESIRANRASADAASEAWDRLHASEFLVYAHLQQAQDGAARAVLDELAAQAPGAEEGPTEWAMRARTAGRYLLETRRWADAAAFAPPVAAYPLPGAIISFDDVVAYVAQAVGPFTRGMGAARQGNVAAARGEVQRLEALRDALRAADALAPGAAEYVEIWRLEVAAWLAQAAGARAEAVDLLRSAVELEEASDTSDPGAVTPAREQLGELLLEQSEPQQALHELEASGGLQPNRFWQVYGAARAAALTGDDEKATQYYRQLLAQSTDADTERRELAEARVVLAGR
jgi:hypothetical protein